MNIIVDLTAVCYSKGRPKPITDIVFHSMAGSYSGTISWFRNPASQASAHYLVSSTGEVRQMVRDEDMAWHAGIFDAGRPPARLLPNPNYGSIGIELEDKAQDAAYRYPQPQIDAAIALATHLCDKWGIPKDGNYFWDHKYLNPSRRHDPVGNWDLNWIKAGVNPPPPAPTPPPIPEWRLNLVDIPDVTKVFEKEVRFINYDTNVVKIFPVASLVTVHFQTFVKGVRYYMTKYSVETSAPTGFVADEFDYIKPPEPVPTTTTSTTSSTSSTSTSSSSTTTQPPIIVGPSPITEFIKKLIDWIKRILNLRIG